MGLNGKVHVGNAGGAVGADIDLVGVDAVGTEPEVGDIVRAEGVADTGVGSRAQVCPYVEDAVGLPSGDLSVAGNARLEMDGGGQPGTVEGEHLFPGVDQLHWPACLHGQQGRECLEGQPELGPEATSQLHSVDLDVGQRYIQHRGQLSAYLVRPLG